MLPDFLVPIAGMATGLILLLPIVRAVVRITEKKISGRAESQELLILREEIRLVQERVDRVEYVDDRVSEMEERLDFAERLLAQHRDAPRIEGGG